MKIKPLKMLFSQDHKFERIKKEYVFQYFIGENYIFYFLF